MKTLKRVLITVIVLVFAVPVALVAAVAIDLHFAWAPDDVRKKVEAADFQQRHAALVADDDRALRTFVSTSPHGSELATSVYDHCLAATQSIVGKPTTHCQRNMVLYLALDSDSAALQQSWGKSLATAGWNNENPDHPLGPYQMFGSTRDDGDPVRLDWHSAPAVPTPVSDFEKGIPYQTFKNQVTLEQRAIDVAAVYREAYAHHRIVVELRVLHSYYPWPRGSEPTPTTIGTGNGCFGGHGNCPGG